MVTGITKYASEGKYVGEHKVKFLVKATGIVLERGFVTIRDATRFARKIEYSKKCELLSCPSEEER